MQASRELTFSLVRDPQHNALQCFADGACLIANITI